ncbi:FecCD family ABC transporter permease [Methanogenium organophilum]|uniref:Cobalamin import system permease protein BtuC n=1 Tax=Methanogenium organophilum TaxID=2199 RepID=A0A9X9S250_METOG|nr:iron ABC transporter permease [Methanogenium organophilum]WAI00438.1 iron ABC transporter permease [Methanogenium organophilum]
MHFADGKIPEGYLKYTGRKVTVIAIGIVVLLIMLVVSIAVGAVEIPVKSVIGTLSGMATDPLYDRIIWNIRLPQVLAAVVAGAGLAISGLAMQSVLRNPLASPQTLGISHAAAFGAAFSVIILGTGTMRSSGADAIVLDNPYITTMFAFLFCLIATGIIIGISRIRASSPEVMVLAGVAISSLAFAGTMFLQYFADDVQLAAVVFWTFGDVGRAGWNELFIMTIVVVLALLYFFLKRWDFNAIDAGDETAKGLGVNVGRERIVGMVVASFVTAVIVAFLGVIGFVGLVCPHMVRPIIGDDHRYLLPGTCVCGALLLLASDTAARLILAPHILPVAILTAFMGAPVFLYLIVRGRS